MNKDSAETPPSREPFQWGKSKVPHGLKNTEDEWTRYIEAVRKPEASKEVDRIRKGRPTGHKDDEVGKVIAWSGILEIGRIEGLQDQNDLYEEALEIVGPIVSRWAQQPDLAAIERFRDRVEARFKEYEPTPSDQAKLMALKLVKIYLSEEKRLITKKRLIRLVNERMKFIGIQISFGHRHLGEIGLDGLPTKYQDPEIE